jgi:hypothetical protein
MTGRCAHLEDYPRSCSVSRGAKKPVEESIAGISLGRSWPVCTPGVHLISATSRNDGEMMTGQDDVPAAPLPALRFCRPRIVRTLM